MLFFFFVMRQEVSAPSGKNLPSFITLNSFRCPALERQYAYKRNEIKLHTKEDVDYSLL